MISDGDTQVVLLSTQTSYTISYASHSRSSVLSSLCSPLIRSFLRLMKGWRDESMDE